MKKPWKKDNDNMNRFVNRLFEESDKNENTNLNHIAKYGAVTYMEDGAINFWYRGKKEECVDIEFKHNRISYYIDDGKQEYRGDDVWPNRLTMLNIIEILKGIK